MFVFRFNKPWCIIEKKKNCKFQIQHIILSVKMRYITWHIIFVLSGKEISQKTRHVDASPYLFLHPTWRDQLEERRDDLRSSVYFRIIIVLNCKHFLLNSAARKSINVSLTTWNWQLGSWLLRVIHFRTNSPTPIQIPSCHRNNSGINSVCSIELWYLFWRFTT